MSASGGEGILIALVIGVIRGFAFGVGYVDAITVVVVAEQRGIAGVIGDVDNSVERAFVPDLPLSQHVAYHVCMLCMLH